MNRLFLKLAILLFPTVLSAQALLVEDGQPRAEIVIAEDAKRTTRLAADELQHVLKQISGAQLTITDVPTADVRIYVGESEHTGRLGLSAENLEFGAYRIVSGDSWLALIGDDTEFEPREPWARNNGGRAELQPRWEEASGLPYGVPNGGMYKNRKRMPEHLAREDGENFWGFDERGSYNAVCGFLRHLGCRWYMPGPLGEVIPDMPTIPLGEFDETAKPDFEIRQFSARIGNCDDEVTRWIMQLGTRNVNGLMIAHGMHTMTHPAELKSKHPEWFALYGGERDTQTNVRLNHLCYSNEELFEEAVKWARAQFDVYDYEGVSIMPPDAYGSICQCELCEGKQHLEMGSRGSLSNHVWDFANRVAVETAKTHPDKLIVCCAYGANTDPPTNIESLEPNVQVVIVGGRRPRNSLPEQQEAVTALREGWLKLTDRPIMIFENYPFTARGTYVPAFVARVNGETINTTKGGISRGEDIWLSFPRFHDAPAMALDAFQIYHTARMYWGGPDADAGALLEEYCDTFYGPAGPAMLKFFDYSEAHYQAMHTEVEPVRTVLAIFGEAVSSVEPGSIYAQRLDLMSEFLEPLRNKEDQLSQGRGPVPGMRTVWEPREKIVIDGKFDDEFWVRHAKWSKAPLRELQTGGRPVFGTTAMAAWDRGGNNLYFAIRCEDRPGEPLRVTSSDHDDQAIWYGDAVEILLDTDSHRYYQIAVNPAGALVDLDRGADRSAWFRWESQAEVATHVADDHWTIEIRIPVSQDDNDPLNFVIGRKPSQSLPWHINICRQRIRDNGSELSAFSPTGTAGFHEPMKFAYFWDGHSRSWEVDETITDFLIEYSAAAKLMRGRKYDEALPALVALTEHENVTDLQKSRVLADAATCARSSGDFEKALELVERIPLEPHAKIATMEVLSGKRDWSAIVEQFGGEDLSQWPFTKIGAAAGLRGRAFAFAKQGEKAEADFQLALEFISDPRQRTSLLSAMARNRETVLQNEDSALETYRVITSSTTNRGGSEYYSAIQAAARILTKRQEFDEAMKILDQVDAAKLGGSWSPSMWLARGETLAAAGRKDGALQAYRAVLQSDSASKAHREKAEAAIQELE